jgi:hypothetical protein
MQRKTTETKPPRPIRLSKKVVKTIREANFVVHRLVKPQKTLALIGVVQRLSAESMRMSGPTTDIAKEFVSRVPKLDKPTIEVIRKGLRAILNGERDAYKAFDLDVQTTRRPSVKGRVMAAEVLLREEIFGPSPRYRASVAKEYSLSPQAVASAVRANRQELIEWINASAAWGETKGVSRRHMLAYLLTHLPTVNAKRSEPNVDPWTVVTTILADSWTLRDSAPDKQFYLEFPSPVPAN